MNGSSPSVNHPRVIFVTREGYDLPGARVRCYQFARALERYGVQTSVLSYADTLGAKSGAREHEMGWAEKCWMNVRAFSRLARAGRAVIVLSRCNYHALGPAFHHLLFRHPFILDLDDWEMRDNPLYRWGWYPTSKAHWLTRWLARRSVACLAASRKLYELLRPWNDHVEYLPTGVDTTVFAPHPFESRRAGVMFAWVGTFHHREYVEDIQWLIRCFAQVQRRIPEAMLDVVGDGLYRDDVVNAIRASALANVQWKGWLAPDRIPAYLDSVDVGCYPLARPTTFNRAKSPTKVFEYMAMGKAVIARGIGDVTAIIRHGDNGLLAETAEAFTHAMIAAGQDAAGRERLGRAARETVQERYSLDRLGEQLYHVVQRVSEGSARP